MSTDGDSTVKKKSCISVRQFGGGRKEIVPRLITIAIHRVTALAGAKRNRYID